METAAVWVGVDVAKDKLDVAVRPSGEMFGVPNNERAAGALVRRLLALGCARIVVEATGDYETVVVAALHASGLPVVVNPRWIRSFAKGLGLLGQDRPHRRTHLGAVRGACRA